MAYFLMVRLNYVPFKKNYLDRGWFGKNSTGKKEGSQYLGRVLLAMQLLPNDRPLLQTAISAPVKEPS